MSETWTTLKVLDWTAGRFERAGFSSARLDAQVLLSHALGCDRVALYANFDKPLEAEELSQIRALIERRLGGEPVAYLTGKQEFWSLRFQVDPRVLIPRADTETLVQVALDLGERLGGAAQERKVAEVATGSGAVAIALAHERPSWKLVASDLSEDALAVARANAEANKVADRIRFVQGDLLAPLAGQRFHLLVANLPYVSSADMQTLSPEVRREPRTALWGGEDGLDLLRRLVDAAREHLEDGGFVALEHGFDQGQAVRALAEGADFQHVQTRDDLAGRARVTFFQR